MIGTVPTTLVTEVCGGCDDPIKTASQGLRRLATLCGVMLAASFLLALASPDAHATGMLGPPPEGLEQTYYGEITVSSHVIHAGEEITFTESPKLEGTFEGWGYEEPVNFPGYVSGCTRTSVSCSFKEEYGYPYPAPGKPTNWVIYGAGFCGFFGCANYDTYYYSLGTATISGQVLEGSGKPVPDATVSIAGPEGTSAKTNEAGFYTASLEQAGNYKVSVPESGGLGDITVKECSGNTEGNACDIELEYGSTTASFTVGTKEAGVSISSGNAVPEPATGSVPATFTINLPSAQSEPVTVDYKTVDGTATATANDYTAVPDGSVVIPAGETSAQIQVQVDDGSGQASTESEGFQVQLTSVSGGLPISSEAGSAQGTITVPGISGTVNGKNGKPLANTSITLSGTAGSGQTVTRQIETNTAGKYALYADPGSYALTATAPNTAPGELFASKCPGGSAIANGCQLQLASGARETINFSQGPIAIIAIKFQQLNVATDEVETVPSTGTIDGNKVDLIVTLHNNTATPQKTNVSFGSPIDNSASVGITKSGVSVPAEASMNVDEVLNTNGLAWTNGGEPDPERTIKIMLADGTNETATLTVNPKPVILVHGLWSSAATWHAYVGSGGFLAKVNPLWKGYAVGDGQAPGVMNTEPFEFPASTIAQNAFQEATYIKGVRESTDADHVDIVAHSMGGLISRYYLQELMPEPLPGDTKPVVSHLVMMGTPNEGSLCAYYALAVQQLYKLVSGTPSINQPILQLTTGYVTGFNKEITNARGVPFSILAGIGFRKASVCTTPGELNDGVVTEKSAWWTIPDRTTAPLIHTSETGSEEAFVKWVKPHLAIGPTAAGGGTYSAPPLASSSRVRAHLARAQLTRASGPRAASASNAKEASATHASKTKLCLSTTPVPSLSAGETTSVQAGGKASMAIHVPAHAGGLSAVVLAQPSITTKLIDPHGHLAQTITAGTPEAGGLFRTLSVKSPPAGTWQLQASSAAGTPQSPVSIAVQFDHPPLQVKLSATQVPSKGKHVSGATTLRFTARVSASGHPAKGAHLDFRVLIAGQKAVVLHLRAVHHHLGSYAAQYTPPKNLSSAVVLLRASTKAGSSTATHQLQAGCKQ
jgi:pimeloyl-ACP methyl ester carboxylesterase